MNRSQARALARSVLVASGDYPAATALIADGPLDTFDGRSPVAVITSRSMDVTFDARDEWTLQSGILVSIYVLREAGQAAAVEDRLDDLVRNALTALIETEAFEAIGPSDAFAESAPIRRIDGKSYRVERIPLRADEDYETE